MFAPLHAAPAIEAIGFAGEHFPGARQVACFDTAFHAGMPERAHRLPLPARFPAVRRYGFHGLSYEYVMSTLGPVPPARVVIAHLGNGASLAAVKDGRGIDTTMGLTPTGGVMMGTRTGDLDPGVLIYLAREHGLDPDALEHLVDRESGLLGVGGTSEMKTLLERADRDPAAAQAIEMFCYAIRKAIGSLMAALGGLDLLIFTGGIGEAAAPIRAQVCDGLGCFGVSLDATLNQAGAGVISAGRLPVEVKVVKTDEALITARHAWKVLIGR